MKSFLLLLKLNLMSALAAWRGDGIRKAKGKKDIGRMVLYAFVLLSFAVLIGMVAWMEVSLYDVAAAIGLGEMLIGLAVLLSMVATVMFAIPHTLSALYLSKDTPALAHLPIGARTILAAKWTTVYLTELLTTLGLLLPLVAMHALRVGGVLPWVTGLVTILFVPLLPLGVALLLSSVLGRLTSLTRHKDAWVAVGSMLMVALVLGLEWTIMPAIPDDADAMYFLRLMTDNEALLDLMVGAFPPVKWAVKAISGSGMYLALTAGVGVACIGGLIALLGGDYLHTCLRHTEQGVTRRRTALRRTADADYTPRTPFMAVFLRELNEVLRVPAYFMNGAVGVLMPAIMLMGASVGMTSSEGGDMALSGLLTAWNAFPATDRMLVVAALLSLLCWLDTLPATAISREGQRLPVTRMIPVPAATIVHAKLAVSMAFNAVGSLLMGAAAAILLGAESLPVILGAVLMVNLLSYAVCVVNLAADAIKPSFTWKNETEAIKQNMNSMIGMLFSTAMLALLIAPPILLMDVTTPGTRLALVCAVLLAECAAAYLIDRFVTVPRYARLEP